MKKTYEIEGMKCDGCKKAVQSLLEKVPGVQKVEVDLEKKMATVEGEFLDQELNAALADSKFGIRQ